MKPPTDLELSHGLGYSHGFSPCAPDLAEPIPVCLSRILDWPAHLVTPKQIAAYISGYDDGANCKKRYDLGLI